MLFELLLLTRCIAPTEVTYPRTMWGSSRRVKCWAFAPPGGLADPQVAEAAKEFCTSVLLGKDWIPRLTVHSFERLRDEMV